MKDDVLVQNSLSNTMEAHVDVAKFSCDGVFHRFITAFAIGKDDSGRRLRYSKFSHDRSQCDG